MGKSNNSEIENRGGGVEQWDNERTGLRKTEEGGAKGELIRGQINKERRERESCRFIMISNLN